MSHNIRTLSDAAWIGHVVTPGEFADIDQKTFKAVNGDDGGTWNPGTPIDIGGQGLRIIGPCLVSNNGTIQSNSGTRFILGDNDWPLLKSGHPGRSRDLLNSNALAYAFVASAIDLATVGGVQTRFPAITLIIPLTKLHDQATLGNVAFNFIVVGAHTSAFPSIMPTVSITRMDAFGNVEPLKSVGSGADATGTVSLPTPASGPAWHASGATQTFNYVCDQNNVIDVSQYTYTAIITEEAGTGTFTSGAGNGNIWICEVCSLSNIQDMRFQ